MVADNNFATEYSDLIKQQVYLLSLIVELIRFVFYL